MIQLRRGWGLSIPAGFLAWSHVRLIGAELAALIVTKNRIGSIIMHLNSTKAINYPSYAKRAPEVSHLPRPNRPHYSRSSFYYFEFILPKAVHCAASSMRKHDGPVFHNKHFTPVLHTANFAEHAVIFIPSANLDYRSRYFCVRHCSYPFFNGAAGLEHIKSPACAVCLPSF